MSCAAIFCNAGLFSSSVQFGVVQKLASAMSSSQLGWKQKSQDNKAKSLRITGEKQTKSATSGSHCTLRRNSLND